ncbi:MAG: hypothetical protein N3E41_00495 [Thermofilaceae archaeon]|nr:hypothetical protein [Thermofilaceae archaeon]MDW8004980.1 DNA polymerase domain-containing protein [Thermofilaceae archaeon]
MELFLLECEVGDGFARLWFKDSGSTVAVEERYEHYLLAELDVDSRLAQSLAEAEFKLEQVNRRVFPLGYRELVKVSHPSKRLLARARRHLERAGVRLYDADVGEEQKLLASKRVLALTTLERSRGDAEDRLEPLPLLTLALKVRQQDPLKVTVEAGGRVWRLAGSEVDVVERLVNLVESFDPDVVISNLSVSELFKLARKLKSRYERFKLGRGSLTGGRVFVSQALIESIGLEGLEERCWFSGLPPTLAGETSYGRLVEARQTYLLLVKGYAVPRRGNRSLVLRSAAELHKRDRGGLIRQPVSGVYENVAELDFESMFPNLIVKYNISYETVSDGGIESGFRGLLVDVVEPVLQRRHRLKALKVSLSTGLERHVELRQRELKMLLVSCYGYSGNNRNRLGNPLTFEWINRMAREVMQRVYLYLEDKGHSIVYGDTDSVFVQNPHARPADYSKLAEELSTLTGLPIKLERIYKLLAFPEARSLPGAPLKRYFGLTIDGKLVFKGLEEVRRDSPPVVKALQLELAQTLLQASNVDGVLRNVEKAVQLAREYLRKAVAGELAPEKLVIEKTLCKQEYKSRQPHFAAASLAGRAVKGATVRYVVVNARHRNPFKRVKPWTGGGKRYDVCYAAGLLAKAAANVLSSVTRVEPLCDIGSLNTKIYLNNWLSDYQDGGTEPLVEGERVR